MPSLFGLPANTASAWGLVIGSRFWLARPVLDLVEMAEFTQADIAEQLHEVRGGLIGPRRLPDQRERGGRGECKSFHGTFLHGKPES